LNVKLIFSRYIANVHSRCSLLSQFVTSETFYELNCYITTCLRGCLILTTKSLSKERRREEGAMSQNLIWHCGRRFKLCVIVCLIKLVVPLLMHPPPLFFSRSYQHFSDSRRVCHFYFYRRLRFSRFPRSTLMDLEVLMVPASIPSMAGISPDRRRRLSYGPRNRMQRWNGTILTIYVFLLRASCEPIPKAVC